MGHVTTTGDVGVVADGSVARVVDIGVEVVESMGIVLQVCYDSNRDLTSAIYLHTILPYIQMTVGGNYVIFSYQLSSNASYTLMFCLT